MVLLLLLLESIEQMLKQRTYRMIDRLWNEMTRRAERDDSIQVINK